MAKVGGEHSVGEGYCSGVVCLGQTGSRCSQVSLRVIVDGEDPDLDCCVGLGRIAWITGFTYPSVGGDRGVMCAQLLPF